ncbi:hypothetical protein M8674_07500 [Escherichia coli]|uniref:glycine-rich domain-containing protein n=1 Tax=Escherichia TaxID=561 RepID=UPI0020010935|nr:MULTISPECIES: hypothetical protein [Escherichia]MCK3719950.1 hypothetical protein [Escherichia coli]MCL7923051.1 hypothetical protein [Escherichia coli]
MSKIVRYQGDVRAFASDAQGMERTVFGGTNQADDLTSQITASFLRGWGIVGASEHPSLEDFNAAMYAMSQFIAYQHQMGVPEWHAEQEYHIGSICTHNGESYQSLQNANIGSQPPSAKWTPVLTSKNGLANLGLHETGFATLTSSGNFTVPEGVTELWISGCAGGAGGGSQTTSNVTVAGSGGGSSGGFVQRFKLAVTPGQVIPYTIGAAGTGGAAGGGIGGDGGNTTFGSYLTLLGGKGGAVGQSASDSASGGIGGLGGPTGSGGGHGSWGGDSQNTNGGGAYGGKCGDCPFGSAGGQVRGNVNPIAGMDAVGYGAGGGGAGGANVNGAHTGAKGGNGAPGVLFIEW